MSTWAIIRNLGTILGFLKYIKYFVKTVVETKKVPPKHMVKQLIDEIQKLLENGVIDIPGVDEKEVSDALQKIEDQLCK